ncbi:hypothetical protein [Bacillus sp. FJAT-50079]|uniref:hypothetical protein n=1 Tax=Bacillus sp. FJAT-50079 TaxID=2833577 RepID=UPI001BC948AC|nr:hypothetical protein [Bacillus sp. FJAT-50079]MBS4207123.1 hypothetical protein [Bacillus sp. FJAT-50079]
MEGKMLGKNGIIALVKKYGDIEDELDQTTLEKRLDCVIDFLNEDRVKSVLEQQTPKDAGNYFYNKEMNISRAKYKSSVFEGYNYNLIDAIFLAVLTSLFDQSLLKKLRTQKNIKDVYQEEINWMEDSTRILYQFEGLWNQEGNGKEWKIIAINIESLFYRLTLLPDMSRYAVEIQSQLQSILNTFIPLPDEHKVAFYGKVMKNRITKMQTELDLYIQELKQNDPKSYYFYKSNQMLADIDKNYD